MLVQLLIPVFGMILSFLYMHSDTHIDTDSSDSDHDEIV